MIKHEGSKWTLYTADGSKVLGTHDSKADAEAQERAVQWSKHSMADHATGAMVLQTVILDKKHFTQDEARKWCDKHGFKTDVDETEDSYRFRQREPGDFIDGSFRTVPFGDDTGIVSVQGHLKEKEPAKMSDCLWYGVSLELPTVQLSEGDGDNERTSAPSISTIQLSREGKWMHPVYGPLEFDAARYQRFIQNFEANVRKTQLALDIEHLPLEGAAAWFIPYEMRMQPTDQGIGLFVDVRWTPNGLQRVRDEEYKYVSLTFKPEWTDPETGQTFQDVVFGAALTTDPFIKGMRPVQDGLVMLSEFVEVTAKLSEGDAKMPQSAEALRQEKFLSGEGGKPANEREKVVGKAGELDKGKPEGKPEELAGATQQPCPDCEGSGKADNKTCALCNGSGEIPEPGAANLSDDPSKVKAELEAIQKKEAAEKAKTHAAHEKIEGEENGAIAKLDDGNDASAEQMAEAFHAQGKALCEKLSGKTGAPMVRQHMAATHKLLGPILEKMKGEPAQMSETAATHPEFVKLAERLQAVEDEGKRLKSENAKLHEKERRNEIVKLTEGWFPRPGEEGFRCKSGDRVKVRDLLMELSALDTTQNEQLIKLSEGAAVPEDRKSKLVSRVVALVESIPEPRLLNLTGRAVSELDPEHDITDDRSRMTEEAHRLSETDKIPFAQAARKVATRKK